MVATGTQRQAKSRSEMPQTTEKKQMAGKNQTIQRFLSSREICQGLEKKCQGPKKGGKSPSINKKKDAGSAGGYFQ